jgi:TonB family protein
MKKFSIAAIALSVLATSPAFAEEVDPETVLNDLRYDSKARIGWAESRSMWEGHVGRSKSRWQYEMKVVYGITASGRMTGCDIVRSSGSAEFDNAACSRLLRESRFEPKRDASGKAVRSSGEATFQLYSQPGWICGTGLDEWDAEEQ